MDFTSFLFGTGLGKARLLELTISTWPIRVAVEDPILDCLEDHVDEVDKALVVGLSAGDEIVLKGGLLRLQQNIVANQAGIL
jgi:hypothetical protein